MTHDSYKILLAAENKDGPISRYFFSLARQLVAMGNSVTILVDEFKVNQPYRESSGFIVKNWPTRRATKLRDAVFLAKLIRREKPDALIGNFGSVNIMLLVGWVFGVKNRIAWYHTVSKAQALNFAGKALKFKFLVFRKRWVYQFTTGIIAVSNEAGKDFTRTYKSNKIVTTLPLLIDDPAESPESLNTKKDALYITIIGRMTLSKDQFTAIKAMKHVIPQLPNLQLKLIGDGELKTELQTFAKEQGVNNNCSFVGHQPHATVFAMLKNSQINLCTSIDEAFGLVNIQALGMGVPVIGTNVGGIKDIIKNGKNGFLVDVGDEKALAEKILKILNDRNLHQNLVNNARKDFERHYLLSQDKLQYQVEKISKAFG